MDEQRRQEESERHKEWVSGVMKDGILVITCPACDNRFGIPGATLEQTIVAPHPMSKHIIQPDKLGELAVALAKARVAFKPIPRNQTVNVKMKAGGQYSFKFADLGTILAATTDALAENGLAVIQLPVDEDSSFIETILAHESGCAIVSRQSLPAYLQVNTDYDLNKAMQSRGSAISFLRRYAISAVLNIAIQDDDDANIAIGNEVQQGDSKPKDKGKQPEKEKQQPTKTALDSLKIKYHELARELNAFPDDKARHEWQGLIVGKPSTKDWTKANTDKGILFLNWRAKVGADSDTILEYLAKYKGNKGMSKTFLTIMGVSKVTEIEDVSHWGIGMSSALQWYNTKEATAIGMGKALLRAAQHEGLVSHFLKICEVGKISKLSKEQVMEWRSLLSKTIAEWMEVYEKAIDPASVLDEPKEGEEEIK